MKRILILSCLFVLMAFSMYAADKPAETKKPEPLAKKEFPFPNYTETKLKNGIKVFVIEDHEQPTFSMRVLIPGGSSVEGAKTGVANLMAQLLTKGAGERNALDLAKALDGVGAGVSASAGIDYVSIYGSSLKKHMPLVLGIMSDVILKPTFPDDEFDKLVPQVLAGLQDQKSNPGVIGAALAKKAVYGENHPYSARETEQSVKSIKLKDIENYYKTYFKPNNVTIAVVGDFKPAEILPQLEKAFGGWEKGDVPEIKLPPTKPMPLGVYFVNRPGSVQSSVVLTEPTVPYSNDKYEAIGITSNVIGAGFAGRLFRTLRETYSYTYTPYGFQTSSKYNNRFACGADVRNSVTDSAITVIKQQLSLLGTEAPSEEELNRIKKYEVGTYLMSFENSEFIASLIQNADFQGVPLQKLKDYPDRIMRVNPYEVKDLANQYLNPDKAYIVVVGSPDVKAKLEKFGKLYEYDLDLNPLTGENAKMEKVSLDADDLVEKYVDAIGGKDAISGVQTLVNNAKAKLTTSDGQTVSGTYLQKNKAPNKSYNLLDLGFIKQTMITDGSSSWVVGQDGITKQEGTELEKSLFISVLFNVTKLKDLGYKAEVLGKQNGMILMKVKSPKGMESTYYFDEKTYLISKIESVEESPQGSMPVVESMSDYVKAGNVLLPGVTETVLPMFTVKIENSYEVNAPVEDDLFTEPKEAKQ